MYGVESILPLVFDFLQIGRRIQPLKNSEPYHRYVMIVLSEMLIKTEAASVHYFTSYSGLVVIHPIAETGGTTHVL